MRRCVVPGNITRTFRISEMFEQAGGGGGVGGWRENCRVRDKDEGRSNSEAPNEQILHRERENKRARMK